MSDQAELSISALRKKRGESKSTDSTGANGSWHDSQEDAANSQDQQQWSEARTGAREQTRMPWEDREPARPALPYRDESIDGEPEGVRLPFDPIRILDALKETWKWWAGAAVVLGALGFLAGFAGKNYVLSMQLMRREIPVAFRASENGDSFKPQYLSEATLMDILKAPEVLRRVSSKANPPVPAGKFSYGLTAAAEQGAELINLNYNTTLKPKQAVDLLNLYGQELVKFTQEMQSREAKEVVSYLGDKLAGVERELQTVNTQMNGFSAEEKFGNPDKQTETFLAQMNDLDLKIETTRLELESEDLKIGSLQRELELRNPIADKLQVAKDELQNLLVKYTDEHPAVQEQRAKIAALEEQLKNYRNDPNKKFTGSTAADGLYINIDQIKAHKATLARQLETLQQRKTKLQGSFAKVSESGLAYATVKSRYQSLDTMRSVLTSRQREAQLYVDNPTGYFRVFTPASLDRIGMKSPWKKTIVFAFAGMFFGLFSVMGFVTVREVLDDTLKSAADVERATGLPVLGTLGDLNKMTPAEQADWAFRNWTIIKGKLSADQNDGIVCGFISAHHGEGRSTWIQLLSATANSRGMRVLTVATRPSDQPKVHPHEPGESEKSEVLAPSTLLTHPAQVERQLADPCANQIVHIPLPGWVWNLERRRQWQTAMEHWGRIENLVLLVELPPATVPESVLLAEKLPQLIWLADSGKVTAKEARKHLTTLRHANCNLVGAVLNRETESFFRAQLSRWFGMFALIATLGFASMAQAQETTPDATASTNQIPTAGSLSVNDPRHRAEWQKHLTLGPGDILNVSFFGETNLTKSDVAVGPDGRFSYMQATVMASGLTVDQLRETLNQELSKYYRTPRVILMPVDYHSKKYYVLGKVMTRGVFALDRPVTIVEALSRAHGFETAMLDRDSIDLADLQHSFLVRDGKRLPIDFEKLFYQGDLSQNIPIEPNDFLYFPPTDLKEVYVVGKVNGPGVLPWTKDISVISAITQRGGFAPESFKSRVAVIRGSLNKPETFVVDTLAITDGRAKDFKLQPKDIVYVSKRPFIKAEELLDIAATAFIQAATTGWAGQHVGPWITSPIIGGLH